VTLRLNSLFHVWIQHRMIQAVKSSVDETNFIEESNKEFSEVRDTDVERTRLRIQRFYSMKAIYHII
jgi:hypothetical protein